MSMHKIPLTPIEEAGLRAQGLDIGTPSQLSDAFRQDVAWCQKAERENRYPYPTWIRISDRWPDEKTSVLVMTYEGMAVCAWEWVAEKRWWTPTVGFGIRPQTGA